MTLPQIQFACLGNSFGNSSCPRSFSLEPVFHPLRGETIFSKQSSTNIPRYSEDIQINLPDFRKIIILSRFQWKNRSKQLASSVSTKSAAYRKTKPMGKPPKRIEHDGCGRRRGTLEKELHFSKRLLECSKNPNRQTAQKEGNLAARDKRTPPNSPRSVYHRSNNFHHALRYNRKGRIQKKEDFQQSDVNTLSDSTSPQTKNTKLSRLWPQQQPGLLIGKQFWTGGNPISQSMILSRIQKRVIPHSGCWRVRKGVGRLGNGRGGERNKAGKDSSVGIQEGGQASNYIQFSKHNIQMEDTTSLQCQFEGDCSGRPFQCPCGRNYRSYPALFTHVKNKHDGKPPGTLKRPSLPSKRRGRPPSQPKPSVSASPTPRLGKQGSCEFALSGQNPRKSIKDLSGEQCILRLAGLLQNLSDECWSRKQLNEIQAIIEMNVYLVTKGNPGVSCPIGDTICQFLEKISCLVEWPKFQQLYMLLMVFLQFIIDELGNGKIICSGSIDLLCDYINDFVQQGMEGMIAHYRIQQLPVFREPNLLEIFGLFFQWLMCSGHTMYKISLNQHFKRVETKAEI